MRADIRIHRYMALKEVWKPYGADARYWFRSLMFPALNTSVTGWKHRSSTMRYADYFYKEV